MPKVSEGEGLQVIDLAEAEGFHTSPCSVAVALLLHDFGLISDEVLLSIYLGVPHRHFAGALESSPTLSDDPFAL